MDYEKRDADKETAYSANHGDTSLASCEGGDQEEQLMHAGSGSAGGDDVRSSQAANNYNQEEEGKDDISVRADVDDPAPGGQFYEEPHQSPQRNRSAQQMQNPQE